MAEPQEFGPQEFGPQEFGPQEFGPQEFGPQEPHDRPDDPHVTHDVITTGDPAPPARCRPEALTLIIGVLALTMSVAAFVGWAPDLTGFDPRWVLAAAAAVVGALLLVRRRR